MAYELRLAGAPKGCFDTEEAAVAAARDIIRANADAEPEIYDLETGKPCAPGASTSWREELANRVGF
jgi:hypothetical protein